MPADAQVVDVSGRRVRLTHLDRVLYPETGTTKAEVIDYVTRIAPVMLPHLSDRPVTRKRWPEGVDHPPFFAKAIEPGAPEWIPRRTIVHSTGAKEYPLIEEVAALVYVAQGGGLELHTPQWRFDADGARSNPDRLVLDLDPGQGVGLAECAQVARWAREILGGMGMELHPVTSGSKGIHLYAGLDGTRSSEEISVFARELARALESDHADLVVSQMAKKQRDGKVFVDWSQNNAAKTTIAPYSLRGRSRPTVAAPRTWAELDDPDLRQLLFDEVLERAARDGDLLAALAPVAEGPLSRYIAKRSAARTPEPVPDSSTAASDPTFHRFVIHEHHARRLHWDLRLERDGVLESWAVPRGMPDSPERNHLAVMTEPHPIDYLTFAGDIPKGEYGAGHVDIWDIGTYAAEKWRDDEIIFTLTGRAGGPLERAGGAAGVRFALIRTQGQGEKSQWLLHLMKPDAAASAPAEREAQPPVGSAEPTSSIRPMLATPATAADATRAAARWGDPVWAEFKWDGVRALGFWDGSRLRLRARSGTDITARYPELTGADVGLGPHPAIVDGEIVALDATGRPSFTRLQNRMHLSKPREIAREQPRTPVTYVLFDVLRVGSDDLSGQPLAERHRALESLTARAEPAIVLPPVSDDVAAALATARQLGLEGIVVKDPRSPYREGTRSERWLKVKLTHAQEVLVAGIRPGKGGRTGSIGSLLLGIPGPDGLDYVGRVGSGFTERELARLETVLTPLRTDACPLRGVPAADAADALWVRPELVGEVEFAEFTPAGILRQARWRGLRADISPADVHREG